MDLDRWSFAKFYRRGDAMPVAFAGADFTRVKRALGAPLDDVTAGEIAICGTHDDVDVVCAIELYDGEIENVRTCVARIDPPLLLSVSGRSSDVRPLVLPFDRWFAAPVDDRAPELIAEASEALRGGAIASALAGKGLMAYVTDPIVIVEHDPYAAQNPGHGGGRSGLIAIPPRDAPLDIACAVASALRAARENLPLTWEEGVLEAWRDVGDACALDVDARRFAMRGRPLGQALTIELTTLGRRIVTVIEVAIDRAHEVGLRIFEASTATRIKSLFRVMQDIVVGDDAFDRRFVVQGHPEGAVRELLRSTFTRRMLALAETPGLRSIGLQDGMLEVIVDGPLDDPSALARVVDDASEAARALVAGTASSAYRD
jgi:hypothetical protein